MLRIQMILVGMLWCAIWLPFLCLSEETEWRPLPRAMAMRRNTSAVSHMNRWQDAKNYAELHKYIDEAPQMNKHSYDGGGATRYQYDGNGGGGGGKSGSDHVAPGYRYRYTSGSGINDHETTPPMNDIQNYANRYSYENPYNQMNHVVKPNVEQNGYDMKPIDSFEGKPNGDHHNGFQMKPTVQNEFETKPNGFDAKPYSQNGYDASKHNNDGVGVKPNAQNNDYDANPSVPNDYGDVIKPNNFATSLTRDPPFYGDFRPSNSQKEVDDDDKNAQPQPDYDESSQENPDYANDGEVPTSEQMYNDGDNDNYIDGQVELPHLRPIPNLPTFPTIRPSEFVESPKHVGHAISTFSPSSSPYPPLLPEHGPTSEPVQHRPPMEDTPAPHQNGDESFIKHFQGPPTITRNKDRPEQEVVNFRIPQDSSKQPHENYNHEENAQEPNGINDSFFRLAMKVVHNTLYYGDMVHRTTDMHI